MLKKVLYYLMLAITLIRLGTLVYLVVRPQGTNLPLPVIVSASVMILYGILLGLRRFLSSVRLGQLMAYYIVLSLSVAFNLFFAAFYVPVRLTLVEAVVLGTFLDLLVNIVIVRFCLRQRKSNLFTVGEV